MKFKELGKTRQIISSVGQGSMGIGGYIAKDTSHDLEYISNMRNGIDLGLTFIDTAEGYGAGHSEELIGRSLTGIRDKAFIASKVSPENLKYSDVIKACEKSLKRLNTEHIDLYQIHWPNPGVPIRETLDAMNMLCRQGKIRFIGVSNFSLGQLKEAQRAYPDTISAVQVEYNLFDRSIENDLLPYCIEHGITVVAYSPLNQGKIAYNVQQIEMLKTIGEKYSMTQAQIVLNWIISHQGVFAIPKAVSADHIRQNALASDFELGPEDIEAINCAFTTTPITVPVGRIKVVLDGEGNRVAYQTLDDALRNALGFCPSPIELADDIKRLNEPVKPVRVKRTRDASGRYDFDLVEGRIRYWAWVIAHEGTRPIPALVREGS